MPNHSSRVQVVGPGQACVDYVGHVKRYPVEDSKTDSGLGHEGLHGVRFGRGSISNLSEVHELMTPRISDKS